MSDSLPAAREPTLWDDLANTAPCSEYPDVRVCEEAVALEIALREMLDDDEAVDVAALVMRHGWRPARARTDANVIQLEVRFARARAVEWMERVATHLREALCANLGEHMPRKRATVEVTRIYDEGAE